MLEQLLNIRLGLGNWTIQLRNDINIQFNIPYNKDEVHCYIEVEYVKSFLNTITTTQELTKVIDGFQILSKD